MKNARIVDAHTTNFKIASEVQVYGRFIKLWERLVEYPDGRKVSWDVAGHATTNPAFTVIFPYNSISKTTCLIKEYCQGLNEIKYSLASGGFDSRKHNSILETAQHELSEEVRLRGGRYVRLIKDESDGIGEVKWCRNKFVPYLCIDPVLDTEPMKRDAEEWIEVISSVSMEKVMEIILDGEMMLPSVQTCIMAMNYISKNISK